MQVHSLGLQPRRENIAFQLLDQQHQAEDEQSLGYAKGDQRDGDGEGAGHDRADEGDEARDKGDDRQSHGQRNADKGEADADKDGVDKLDNCLRANEAAQCRPRAGK